MAWTATSFDAIFATSVPGRYDFTRFAYIGHCRRFRWLDERRSGIADGASAF